MKYGEEEKSEQQAFAGCVCTALLLVPTAIAMDSTPMFAVLTFIFFLPLRIAYAPARVSLEVLSRIIFALALR